MEPRVRGFSVSSQQIQNLDDGFYQAYKKGDFQSLKLWIDRLGDEHGRGEVAAKFRKVFISTKFTRPQLNDFIRLFLAKMRDSYLKSSSEDFLLFQAESASFFATRDSVGNNVFHIVCRYGTDAEIIKVFTKCPEEELVIHLNARNHDGTTPMGQVFLNQNLSDQELLEILRKFIQNDDIEINSYLNDKRGMDAYDPNPVLSKIGGFNCLHMSIILNRFDIFTELKERNIPLKKRINALKKRINSGEEMEKLENALVNFDCPAMNPICFRHTIRSAHMTSPKALIKALREDEAYRLKEIKKMLSDESFTYLKEFTNFYADDSRESTFGYESDDSGDSSDDESFAGQYFSHLRDLSKFIDDNSNDQKVSPSDSLVVHFHGVPFMSHQMRHAERRKVGQKFIEINKNYLDKKDLPAKKKQEEAFAKTIFSRSVTASHGVQNLGFLGQETGQKVREMIQTVFAIKQLFQSDTDEESYQAMMQKYINSFSNDKRMVSYWTIFDRLHTIPSQLVTYRYPEVSTAKAPDPAVKFGLGLAVEAGRGENRISYGRWKEITSKKNSVKKMICQHRLAGLLYITAHSVTEYKSLQERKALLDPSNTNIALGARFETQNEVIFHGGLLGSRVKLVLPLVLVNCEGDESKYSKVLKYEGFSLKDKREKLKRLRRIYSNFALRLAQSIARRENKKLVYIDETGAEKEMPAVPDYKDEDKDTSLQTALKLTDDQRKSRKAEQKLNKSERSAVLESEFHREARATAFLKNGIEFERHGELVEAFACYENAAIKGSSEAIEKIGSLYRRGVGFSLKFDRGNIKKIRVDKRLIDQEFKLLKEEDVYIAEVGGAAPSDLHSLLTFRKIFMKSQAESEQESRLELAKCYINPEHDFHNRDLGILLLKELAASSTSSKYCGRAAAILASIYYSQDEKEKAYTQLDSRIAQDDPKDSLKLAKSCVDPDSYFHNRDLGLHILEKLAFNREKVITRRRAAIILALLHCSQGETTQAYAALCLRDSDERDEMLDLLKKSKEFEPKGAMACVSGISIDKRQDLIKFLEKKDKKESG